MSMKLIFSGRGYNIESLAVAEVDQKENLSRITIVTTGKNKDESKALLAEFGFPFND